MADALTFDATAVEPSKPRGDVIPNGKYRAHVTDSEIKPTTNGTGKYLLLVWEVLDGEYKGAKLFDRLNIVNANATAQEIAQRALSAVCHAVDVLKLTNSGQLHHKPAIIKVKVKAGDPKKDAQGNVLKDEHGNVQYYDPSNEVQGYEKVNGAPTPTAAPAQAANVPAWAKKAS